jgi:hypothetical protein
MSDSRKILGFSAIAWAFFTLAGFTMMVLVSPLRNYDIYNLQGGMRALAERPVLVIAGQVAYAWAGIALVCMALSFKDWLPAISHTFFARGATTFAGIAGSFFLFYGMVGGLALFELRYVQSVHSAEYARQAYLPLTLVMNRTFAAAITVSGLWFTLANWMALQEHALPRVVPYLGLGAGLVALLGFILPGGGFGILSLLIGALWGILLGVHLLRVRPVLVPG